MARVWHEPHLRDRFRVVSIPRVDEFLGCVVLKPGKVPAQVNVQVERDVHVCSALVVSFFCPVKRARFPARPVLGIIGPCLCRRTDRLRGNLVFLVHDLDLDVLAIFIGRGHIRPFLFELGPWSPVGICPVHD